MKIRKATPADLEAVYAIELENFSSQEAMSREALKAHIKLFPASFLVAEEAGKILGYAEGPVKDQPYLTDDSFTEEVADSSHSEGGYITLTSVSVAKSAQGLGIGRQLLESMKQSALENQRLGISLTCHDVLIPYYENHQFVHHGRSQSNYANGIWHDMVWENPNEKCHIP